MHRILNTILTCFSLRIFLRLLYSKKYSSYCAFTPNERMLRWLPTPTNLRSFMTPHSFNEYMNYMNTSTNVVGTSIRSCKLTIRKNLIPIHYYCYFWFDVLLSDVIVFKFHVSFLFLSLSLSLLSWYNDHDSIWNRYIILHQRVQYL